MRSSGKHGETKDELTIADPHHHFWNLERNYHPWLCDEPMIPFRYGDYSSIRRSFMPEDYHAATGPYRVLKNVTVEAEWDPRDPIGETRWIHEISDTYGVPHGHVAQAWLDQDDVEEVIAAQAAFRLVRSVRHKPRSVKEPQLVEPGLPGSMGDPRFRRGVALLARYGLHFDLQTPWWHLPEAVSLAEAFPETVIILNHTGLPADRSEEGISAWRKAMRRFAVVPNAYVKISGLGLAGRPWRVSENRRIILDTIDIFGPDRCMFASNFPVDSLVADFSTIFDGYREAVAQFSGEEQRNLFYDNAVRIYRL